MTSSTERGWATALANWGGWLTWVLALSAFWFVATLAGAVVLGVAPASVAAATLVRERSLGRHDRVWRDGFRHWARALVQSQAAFLPLAAATAILGTDYLWFSAMGPAAAPARLSTLIAFALTVIALAWAAPLAAHYEVRPWRVTVFATRMLLARPASSALLALVGGAIVYAAARIPFIALFAPGVWFTATTLLCLRFFADNDARQAEGPDEAPRLPLPHEPLRTH